MAVTLGNLGTTTLVGTPSSTTLATKGLVAGTGISFSTSSTDVTISASAIANTLSIGGVSVTGAQSVRILANTSSVVSNSDIYTVPANKRLWLEFVHPLLPSGGTANIITPSIKVSGTYYQLRATVSTASSGSLSALSYIAEAGEVVAISTTQTTATNIWFKGVLFDSTNGLKSAKLLTLSAGNNTLYTCPANKTAYVAPISETSTGLNIYGCFYTNISGGTRTLTLHCVASAGSPGTTNIFLPATTVNTGTIGGAAALAVLGSNLETGDFINVNVDAGTATQYIWLNVAEM